MMALRREFPAISVSVGGPGTLPEVAEAIRHAAEFPEHMTVVILDTRIWGATWYCRHEDHKPIETS